MIASGDRRLILVVGWALCDEVIERGDVYAIDLHAHAVVAIGGKAVVARAERERSAPAHREIIGGEAWRWAARAPVEIDRRIATHQQRRSGQIRVGEVLALPAAGRNVG